MPTCAVVASSTLPKPAAKASDKTADAKDLNGAGCGGFPWTQMTR